MFLVGGSFVLFYFILFFFLFFFFFFEILNKLETLRQAGTSCIVQKQQRDIVWLFSFLILFLFFFHSFFHS